MMTPPRACASLAVVACFTLAALDTRIHTVSAQPSNQAPTELPLLRSSAPTISFQFPGGTASQYIQAVRDAAPDANIVLLGNFEDVPVPPIKLLNVDVLSALTTLTRVPLRTDGRQNAMSIYREGPEQPDQMPVFILSFAPMGQLNPPQESVVVIALKELMKDAQGPEPILTAMQSAAQLSPAASVTLEIKFHPETGLVIARGSDTQLDAIQQVAMRLRDQAGAAQAAHELIGLRHQLEDLQRLHNALILDLEKAASRSEILEKELDRARADANEARVRLADSESRQRSLQKQLEESQQSRDSSPSP